MTYTQLQQQIADYLDRDLTQWETQIQGFIAACEAHMNRKLRVGKMTTRSFATGVADRIWYPFPTDYLACRSIKVDDLALQYLTPQLVTNFLRSSPAAPPRYFTIEANQFRIVPATGDDAYIEITYYQRIPALSETNESNWLLEDEYDLYLYGSLAEAQRYFKNPTELQYWESLFNGRIEDVKTADKGDRWTGVPTQIRVV